MIVWKAKRVLLMMLSLLICTACFGAYSLVLGSIDGLPAFETCRLPLPSELREKICDQPLEGADADKKLVMAFGPYCKELKRTIRLWLSDKRAVVAFDDFAIDKSGDRSGRVRLAPFSAAIFQKGVLPGAHPEISTISCEVAYLTMDQPVTQYGDLNNRTVIAVELVGKQPGITLTNNRRTIEKHDDIDVLITNGNVFWEKRQNRIWTEGVVCLTDMQTKPPTVIRGKGLDLFLAKDGPKKQVKNAKPATNTTNDYGDIEVIKLRSDVQMHFWVEPSSGFLGGTPNKKKDVAHAKPAAAPEKAHIDIRTPGSFVYDLTKEFAWFESPAHQAKSTNGDAEIFAPDQVHVQRTQKVDGNVKFDQLTCDRLELQFRKKTKTDDGLSNDQAGDREIETAKAVTRGSTPVVLALDSEGMAAYGTEMFYRTGDDASGPLTILKGNPLKSFKDGNKLVCKELHLFAANRLGEGQRAWAQGPGQIDLLDTKNPKKDTFPTHVLWRDTLNVTKETEGGQVFDLMVTKGESSFIDDLQKQELHGDTINVWMLQVQEGTKRVDAVGGSKQQLHRVVAQGQVRGRTPDFIVRRTELLTLLFLPESPRNARLPFPAQEAKGTTPPAKNIDPTRPTDKLPGPPAKDTPIVAKEPAKEAPKQPIELEGDSITVSIMTIGETKELQELIAKGNVYVFQAGEKTGEKALDITGTLLTVNDAGKGRLLVVYGADKKPARLEVDDSIVYGPKVTINQATNHADVEGAGTMIIPSNKNIDGSPSTSKSSRIEIQWNKNMTFDGDKKDARFNGGVQAKEIGTPSKVLCQTLQVYLDRPISFKEGQQKQQNAKIDRMVFDHNVFVDHWQLDEKKKAVEQRNMAVCQELINYEGGQARLKGPGEVKTLSLSTGQGLMAAPNGKAQKTEWKLTHVKFSDLMTSNTSEGRKKTFFYGGNDTVEVFHIPTIFIEQKMDPDHPKVDELYLKCGILEVDEKQVDKRISHIMIAKGNVTFKTDKYHGYSNILKYDEATDTVIFEGTNGNMVRLYQIVDGRPQPSAITSAKILYNRKTGKIDTEGVKSISN